MDDQQQRVSFGPKSNQDMPVEWAERLLKLLFSTQRKRFGDLLARVIREWEE